MYLRYTPEKYTDYYWPRRAGLILHISAGALALTVGLLQVFLGLSGRTRRLHRAFGRVYLLAVLLAFAYWLAGTVGVVLRGKEKYLKMPNSWWKGLTSGR